MEPLSATWATVRQAAAELGVTKPRVEQFIRSGRLPSELVDNVRLVRWADVRAFAAIPRGPGRPREAEEGVGEGRPAGKRK